MYYDDTSDSIKAFFAFDISALDWSDSTVTTDGVVAETGAAGNIVEFGTPSGMTTTAGTPAVLDAPSSGLGPFNRDLDGVVIYAQHVSFAGSATNFHLNFDPGSEPVDLSKFLVNGIPADTELVRSSNTIRLSAAAWPNPTTGASFQVLPGALPSITVPTTDSVL